MRFWDASAIVPLVYEESLSDQLGETHRMDPQLVVWWSTRVECASALARRERRGEVASGQVERALALLDELSDQWREVDPAESVRRAAIRLVRVHDLRTADAFQLAAALVVADGQPESLGLVTLDERLAGAAALEGFPVLGR